MSKNVAVFDESGIVVAVNVHLDNYELQSNEMLVTGSAYIGGDYVDGYFYPEKPFPSWTRNEGKWEPPVPYPNDGNRYLWDEETTNWILINPE